LMCSADLKWFELAFLVSELSNGWKRGEKMLETFLHSFIGCNYHLDLC
jgi:hypothetical protein